MQRANKTKHTARQVDHVTHALHNAPAQASSTHHPYTHILFSSGHARPPTPPLYTLWHSFHSSSYIFIYSTSLEAVIYDFNTSTQTIRHPGVEGDSQQQQVDKVLGVAVCLQASQPHSPALPREWMVVMMLRLLFLWVAEDFSRFLLSNFPCL